MKEPQHTINKKTIERLNMYLERFPNMLICSVIMVDENGKCLLLTPEHIRDLTSIKDLMITIVNSNPDIISINPNDN